MKNFSLLIWSLFFFFTTRIETIAQNGLVTKMDTFFVDDPNKPNQMLMKIEKIEAYVCKLGRFSDGDLIEKEALINSKITANNKKVIIKSFLAVVIDEESNKVPEFSSNSEKLPKEMVDFIKNVSTKSIKLVRITNIKGDLKGKEVGLHDFAVQFK